MFGLGKVLRYLSGREVDKGASDGAEVLSHQVADRTLAEGEKLLAGNELDDALKMFRKALLLAPEYWRASFCIGNVAFLKGELVTAVSAYAEAQRLNPEHAGLCYSYGSALAAQGKLAAAEDQLRRTLNLDSRYVDAMVVLADVLERSGKGEEGVVWLDRALVEQPGHAGILHNKVLALEALGLSSDAEKVMHELIEHDPGNRYARYKLAYLNKERGETLSALSHLRAALDHAFHPDICSDYLMLMLYAEGVDQNFLLSEHQRFQNHLFPEKGVTHVVRKGPRSRLRVGFISPDFHTHPVAYFIEPLLKHLDRTKFDVLAYSATEQPDAVTDRLRKHIVVWRDIAGMNARMVAALVAGDRVDVLIDLAGHTGHNRLDAVALKPAPVIATWLGYLATTGLDEVDFRIVDCITDPPGMTEAHHSEKLIRLPSSQWCYQPQIPDLPVGPLPALANGYITFGSFVQMAKLSESALDLWSRLLIALPDSHLRVYGTPGGQARGRIAEKLSASGVDRDRISFFERTDYSAYMASYSDIDVVLDSTPFSGGTTTCEALFMGVPVLTLAGQHSCARSSASLMTSLGLAEWIANSPEEFVAAGRRLCSDFSGIAQLRSGMRTRMLASPVGDQALFARHFEALLKRMWSQACDSDQDL